MAYGLVAALGQTVYTVARHARITYALERTPIQEWTVREFFFANWKREHAVDVHYDVFTDALSRIKRYLLDEQEPSPWASPFLNAFDLEHRKKLNYKIQVLEAQIDLLTEEIDSILANKQEL